MRTYYKYNNNCGINKGATRFGANHYTALACTVTYVYVPFDDPAPGRPARVRAYLNKISLSDRNLSNQCIRLVVV